MKRTIDIIGSFLGLVVLSPLLLIAAMGIYLADRYSPLHVSKRIGKGKKPFSMYKLRTMVPQAYRLGGDSTPSNDPRITKIGHFLRKYKIDEIPQLWNVLKGDMSLVGPRPNVVAQGKFYAKDDDAIFSVLPGITDFASIVFSNEGALLEKSKSPDEDYLTYFHPVKKRLAKKYIEMRSTLLDLNLCLLTILSFVNRRLAIQGVSRILGSKAEPLFHEFMDL